MVRRRVRDSENWNANEAEDEEFEEELRSGLSNQKATLYAARQDPNYRLYLNEERASRRKRAGERFRRILKENHPEARAIVRKLNPMNQTDWAIPGNTKSNKKTALKFTKPMINYTATNPEAQKDLKEMAKDAQDIQTNYANIVQGTYGKLHKLGTGPMKLVNRKQLNLAAKADLDVQPDLAAKTYKAHGSLTHTQFRSKVKKDTKMKRAKLYSQKERSIMRFQMTTMRELMGGGKARPLSMEEKQELKERVNQYVDNYKE